MAGVGNITRHLGLEIRRTLDVTLSTRHQIPADGSAVILDGRYRCSLLQGNRHRCGEIYIARKIAIEISFGLIDRASLVACTCVGRYYRPLVQGSFGFMCHCRRRRGCQGGSGCGWRHLCRRASIAVDITLYAQITVPVFHTGSRAAVAGDSDLCLPFGKDRLTGCPGGVDGAHEAHKGEDDRLCGRHFADWVRLMDAKMNVSVV